MAGRKLVPLRCHFPSKAWAKGRGDTLLRAFWSKGWVPKEERQVRDNEAVFFVAHPALGKQ